MASAGRLRRAMLGSLPKNSLPSTRIFWTCSPWAWICPPCIVMPGIFLIKSSAWALVCVLKALALKEVVSPFCSPTTLTPCTRTSPRTLVSSSNISSPSSTGSRMLWILVMVLYPKKVISIFTCGIKGLASSNLPSAPVTVPRSKESVTVLINTLAPIMGVFAAPSITWPVNFRSGRAWSVGRCPKDGSATRNEKIKRKRKW